MVKTIGNRSNSLVFISVIDNNGINFMQSNNHPGNIMKECKTYFIFFYMIIMPHCILSLQFRIIILHRGLWSLIPYDKFATTSAMFTHVIERLKRYFRFFFPSRIDIFNFLFLSNVSPQSTCDDIVVCSKPRNS